MQNKDKNLPVIFLMGPTATGKTALAVELFKALPVEIISVDSAMVYRGMDIGTAKPEPELLKAVPHRLIDICDPSESYSAGRFCQDAADAITEIHAKQKIPLLVGGTGLYFRSLEQGFSELPPADPEIRKKLEAQASALGWGELHERLAAVDPEAAGRINPNDPQRIQRALEVHALTGEPLSAFFRKGRTRTLPFPLYKIIIAPEDRSITHEKIRERFLAMIGAGLVDEVRGLYERGDLGPALPAMRLVGYRQVWQHLAGEISYNIMIDKAIIATRQLFKRQMTWLRAERHGRWFDNTDQELFLKVMDFLQHIPVLSVRL